MRRALSIIGGVTLALACETSSAPSLAPGAPDNTCVAFCGEQQSRGTLVGPLQDCMNACCANSTARCAEDDAAALDVTPPASQDSGGPIDSAVVADVVSTDSTVSQVDSASGDSGELDTGADSACIVCGPGCCSAGQMCLNDVCVTPCGMPSDCTTGCCAPATDATGNPVGPYICKPNDAAPYDCCFGALTECGNNYCCVADTQGNEFCATACTSGATCGTAQCLPYDFSHTTCEGSMACGP